MKNLVAKFTFTVPEGHPEAGKEIEKAFEYKQVDTEQEALSVVTERKWSISKIVNDALKRNARSNAYQNALMPYKPSEVSPEDIKERMIRDYIRLGFKEEQARAQVESMLASKAEAEAAAEDAATEQDA